jgi:hypothetical protein
MNFLKRAYWFVIRFLQTQYTLGTIADILALDYIERHMSEAKYKNGKRLNRFAYQGYSQNGEDGIIAEIFKRIGTTNCYFVEFGAGGDGLENNTAYLLLKKWRGCWIEGNPESVDNIRKRYKTLIKKGRLLIKRAFITAENIERLFREVRVPEELDLLSIDVDGNDYWVWKAINHFRPRVVVIEYNGLFRPDVRWVMKYNSKHVWNGVTGFFGASLKSLEILGKKKGYSLVGCNFQGSNAFFVRDDLVKNKFLSPFTAENHFEPSRLHLVRRYGIKRDFGEFENI